MVRERDIEALFTRLGTECGALVLKLTSPGNNGVPDRLVVRPGGIVEFVELKRPGARPRKLQEAIHAKLREHGVAVYTLDSREAVRDWWDVR